MDWPLIGAVSAVTIVAGVVTFEVVVFMRPDPAPVKAMSRIAGYTPSVERSAYEIPGFATGRPAEWTPSFPLIRLIDPDATPDHETRSRANPVTAPAPAKKSPAASSPAKMPPVGDLDAVKPAPEVKPSTTDTKAATAKTALPDPAPRAAEQWRVVVTSKASYFNLGGHVDRAGIVDSLATGHLRDALKAHRNFGQLPADIKTHILTQNINLTKVAPYRGLLGMNDRTLEEEQAVRFERVASR